MLDQPWPIPMSTTRAGGIGQQAGMEVGDRREPALAEQVQVHRTVRRRLALANIVARHGKREAFAGPEDHEQAGKGRLDRAKQREGGRGGVAQGVEVEQDLGVARRRE